ELMTVHWGLSGEGDGVATRIFTVFGLPLILLAIFWLCLLVTAWDHKKKQQDPKVYGMVFGIIPLISLWGNGMIYASALGFAINPMILVCLLLGLLFLIVGNYMPKCRPNRTIGIKTKQTLSNEENWRATHRFAGRLWVVCGILMLISAFLPEAIAPYFVFAILLGAILPVAIYPYAYSKKQIREGSATREDFKLPRKKLPMVISVILVVVILALVAVLMFTGSVEVRYGETDFTVDVTYTGSVRFFYDEIEEIEYRETSDYGHRVAGFGSPRLSVGSFSNEEFGTYRLYAYTGCDASVVLYMKDDKVVVLNGANAARSEQIFKELSERLSK
ncbi:MAG: SdpI family protein, partial [Clostridia bacterium]|nr:SdpI family protein [Clostridia bacterium]